MGEESREPVAVPVLHRSSWRTGRGGARGTAKGVRGLCGVCGPEAPCRDSRSERPGDIRALEAGCPTRARGGAAGALSPAARIAAARRSCRGSMARAPSAREAVGRDGGRRALAHGRWRRPHDRHQSRRRRLRDASRRRRRAVRERVSGACCRRRATGRATRQSLPGAAAVSDDASAPSPSRRASRATGSMPRASRSTSRRSVLATHPRRARLSLPAQHAELQAAPASACAISTKRLPPLITATVGEPIRLPGSMPKSKARR